MTDYEMKKYWNIFKSSFSVDTSEEPIYMATRSHLGTFCALAMACYNTFLIRQRIIKNAIHLTKSNNPRIVKAMTGIVGFLYFTGLYVIWHIPSFFTEVAVRVYVSTEDVTTNYLLKDHLKNTIFN